MIKSQKIPYKLKSKIVLLPLFTFILCITIVFTVFKSSLNSLNTSVENNIDQVGQLTSKEFENILNSDIGKLENLKNRIEFTNGMFLNYWEKDAELLIEQTQSFRFLEWIDSTMVIRKITPLVGNESALNLDISKVEYRRDEWINHAKFNETNITPWSALTQGGHAFLVDVPVYFNNTFQGTISAGMDFNAKFTKFSSSLNNFYAIELYDHTNTLFFQLNSNNKLNTPASFTFNILVDDLDNQQWTLKLFPSKKFQSTKRRELTSITLIIGLLFSLLISLLVYFYLSVVNERKLALETNNKLITTNKKLNKERKKAEKASLAKTEFLSNMSHEIRTPLHAILGFIELLKESKLNKTNKEYLGLMEKSSSNLLNIVNDILDIDKIESGKIELSEIKFNPFQKVKDLIEVNQFIFLKKDLYLKSKYKKVKDLFVTGDEGKFVQIINNLLKNALKFTNHGGITLIYNEKVTQNNKLEIKISIKDTGIGIPPDKMDSIFERFKQIENSIKKQYEGSGLGLAISKIFINMMDGDITVKSKLNEGTTFKFNVVFPILPNQNEFKIKSLTSEDSTNLSKLNVLIVDDNKLNVIVLKKFLESFNIKAQTADNGKVGLDKFKSGNFHLIFMDIHMPVMDGWEATKEIRKLDKDVIILGLSANVTPEAISKALENGMNNYLSKPFKKEHIAKLLNFHFNNYNN
ncbi:response regulator [Neotamlana laminarinivorans]|uniref:histidine kinase n=1 Tax=Neotamlana laminarinivorans TaxID=2883124 RepID=A0A9X1L4L3_9FLAO|nr:response regulator [Tamlana laminarinivorans]MCB4799437.1 response regulator [Tamlana laminarinivorans]